MINEYLCKINQNLVHYLSCQAVRRTKYLNFCSGRMLKGLGLEGPGLGLEGSGFGLGLGLEGCGFGLGLGFEG